MVKFALAAADPTKIESEGLQIRGLRKNGKGCRPPCYSSSRHAADGGEGLSAIGAFFVLPARIAAFEAALGAVEIDFWHDAPLSEYPTKLVAYSDRVGLEWASKLD